MKLKKRLKARFARAVYNAAPNNDIPPEVPIGRNLRTPHGGLGIVINSLTTIGDNVSIFPNVVIGRFDANLRGAEESTFESIVIEDDVIIYANAVVVGGAGVTRIARGTIVGAGSVVLGSTGEGEVWAGNPAKCVSMRSRLDPNWTEADEREHPPAEFGEEAKMQN